MEDKRIYLSPRKEFDVAIIDESTALYSLTKIIEVLMDGGMSWEDSWEWYCYNIEPLVHYYGLNVEEDDGR